jgi:hypothetical protein
MAGSEPCRQHRHDRLAGGFRRLPAAQPTDFGAKGFFASYDARLDQPLTIVWGSRLGENLRSSSKAGCSGSFR